MDLRFRQQKFSCQTPSTVYATRLICFGSNVKKILLRSIAFPFFIAVTAYEQFNQAFAELRKLGNSNFNPKAIHTCLIKIRCKKYADLIEDLVVGTTEPAMPTTTQNGFNHAASTSSSSLTTQLQLQDNEHCDLLPDSIALAS